MTHFGFHGTDGAMLPGRRPLPELWNWTINSCLIVAVTGNAVPVEQVCGEQISWFYTSLDVEVELCWPDEAAWDNRHFLFSKTM